MLPAFCSVLEFALSLHMKCKRYKRGTITKTCRQRIWSNHVYRVGGPMVGCRDQGKLGNHLHPCVLAEIETQQLLSRMHRNRKQIPGWHSVLEKNFKKIITNIASVLTFGVKSMRYQQGIFKKFFKSYIFMSVEIRGQFGGARSLLLPCGFWGANPGHQVARTFLRVTSLAQGKIFLS